MSGTTRLPAPAEEYDRQNEAATRRAVEHALGQRLVLPPLRPVITGSRSGATVTVLEDLLAALAAQGLIDDQTTA